MSQNKHFVPAGIRALHDKGLSTQSMGKILQLCSHVGAAKRMRGVSPWTVDDLVLLAEALKCRPSDLFDERVAELPIPMEFLDRRLDRHRKLRELRTKTTEAEPPKVSRKVKPSDEAQLRLHVDVPRVREDARNDETPENVAFCDDNASIDAQATGS